MFSESKKDACYSSLEPTHHNPIMASANGIYQNFKRKFDRYALGAQTLRLGLKIKRKKRKQIEELP